MASPPPPLTACVFTHRGAVRDHNEDAVVIGGCTLAAIDFSGTHSVTINADGPIVVAVADGLGGHAAGEVASTHTVYRLAQLAGHMNTPNGITQMLREISDEIYTIHGAAHTNGPATTVVGLVFTADQTWWFNVGDSRLFRLDGGHLRMLSIDDIPLDPLGEAGAVTKTGLVTQVLGGAPTAPLAPHVGQDDPLTNQRYLLCSDGLTDLVTVTELEAILAENPDDDARAVRAMWAAAMNGGGHDNITVVLIRRTGK
jgi:serine/threonine protein phosphatase PrpC